MDSIVTLILLQGYDICTIQYIRMYIHIQYVLKFQNGCHLIFWFAMMTDPCNQVSVFLLQKPVGQQGVCWPIPNRSDMHTYPATLVCCAVFFPTFHSIYEDLSYPVLIAYPIAPHTTGDCSLQLLQIPLFSPYLLSITTIPLSHYGILFTVYSHAN